MLRFLLFFVGIFVSISLSAQSTFDLQAAILKRFPTAEIHTKAATEHFKEQYEILIDQWIDHKDHSKGTFKQRLFLSHHHRKSPMLMVTEGYSASPQVYELSQILKSNQLIVEYRFFGKSVPAEKDYQYLTNQQAMEDLHRINRAFKKIYCKKWISTGVSKGGTTCMYYKATYPKDVHVAVPYVAPLPNAREDKRCDTLLYQAGTEACRKSLAAFQHRALDMQDSLQELAKHNVQRMNLTFERVGGLETAIEYAILEYSFSFWQMGHDCDVVPAQGTAKEVYEHLMKVVGLEFYCDPVVNYYEPAFYQFMTQNGYYGFVHEHLKDKIRHVKIFDNSPFAPSGVSLDYDPSYNKWIRKRLDKYGKRMIYIQGENDPWGALTYVPSSKQDALLMVLENGAHGTKIGDFSDQDQGKIYAKLKQWLRIPVFALEVKK